MIPEPEDVIGVDWRKPRASGDDPFNDFAQLEGVL